MKWLLPLLLTAGCLSTTQRVVTGSRCASPELVLADVMGSAVVATIGVHEDRPPMVLTGTIMLVAATVNWVDQLVECRHLH